MINDEIIENYLNCKYKAYRKLNNEHSIKTEFEILQEEQLSVCKKEFYKRLSEKYGENNLLKGYNFGKNRRVPRTDVIIQPTLCTETYQISFDAIEINPDEKPNSKKIKIPILISPKEKISKIGKLSIAIKCVILSKTCGVEYEFGKIIYGSDLKTVKFKIEPFLTEAKKSLNELNKMFKGESQPIIFHKNHCKICEFQEICKKELVETDSLGLLHRMGEREIRRYNNKGIFTVKQLSYTFRLRKRGNRVKTKQRPYYLSLQALAIREQKVYLYDKIDLPDAKTKIFIDMEGNTDGSFIYLIGVLVIQDNKGKKHSLWANNPSNEKDIFAKLIKILNEHSDGHIFYYGKYESRVFKRLLKFDSSIEIENLILNKSINILGTIYSNIYFPTYLNGLKEIGKYLGCSWSASNPSGIQSIVWRKKWESSNDPGLKDTLIRYNYEDCIALKKITDFIYTILDSGLYRADNPRTKNVVSVEEIKYDHDLPQWSNIKYVSKDIEIVTKCAYFEYQRNKIYVRTNKNFKKIKRRERKNSKIKYKINKIVKLRANKCPYCKSNALFHDENFLHSKEILDMHIFEGGIKRWIVKYITASYKCLDCKKSFLPKSYNKQNKYGYNLKSWVIYQHVANRFTFQNLEKTAQDCFGLPITYQRIYDFKSIVAKYYKCTYKRILQKILTGKIIHIDETKVKLLKTNAYVWVLTNMEEVVYIYRPTRETGFLHDLMKDFDGVLISDFYSGYDSLKCLQQKCIIHLIRELNDSLLKNPLDDELKVLVQMFASIIISVVETIDKFGLKSRHLKKHKKEVERFFNEITNQVFLSDVAEKFQKRMIKYEKKLFTFLDHDGVPWNNNNAEHAVKHFAKYRRLVNGQISEQGLKDYLILLSVYQTCEYKGIRFLDFLLSKEKDIDKFMEKH